MAFLFDRIAIAGVGLIGGSLGIAAKRAGVVGEVVGFGRTRDNLETARRRGLIDRYSLDVREAARGADLLLLSVPVNAMPAIAATAAAELAAGAVVSDAGSVKAEVIRAVEAALPAAVPFVAAHPIAGSDESGAAAADENLFRGAECIVTPGPTSTPAATDKVKRLWQAVGMRVTEMPAERHDDIMAWVSHLPHALAFALTRALAAHDSGFAQHGGPSFREMTRIAASSPELWRDVFVSNRAAVDAAIVAVAAALDELRTLLRAGDAAATQAWIAAARDTKRGWDERGGKR